MENRRRVLLALGITEWASVSAHLNAMRLSGVAIPPDVEREVNRELGVLAATWATLTSASSVEVAIKQARAYLTDNLSEADAVAAGVRNG